MKTPNVSVIITTKNEAGNIDACLESINRQTYTDIEIIVVDNHSKDATKQIAKRFTQNIFDRGPERSAQRNYGAKLAKGRYLVFLDADMILTQNVVEECIHKMEKNKTLKALVIPERSQGNGFWSKCKILERTYYEGVDWMEAARFYDTKTFLILGGFDEDLTGPEDFDLSQRVIARYGPSSVSRITSYIYHNEGTIKLGDLLRKKYYYGRKMNRYMNKNENKPAFQKQANPFSRYILFFQKPGILFSDPLHAIGMIIMKTLELGALAFGTIAGRI